MASARLLVALLALLLVAATLAACGGDSDGSGDGDASGMTSNGGGDGGGDGDGDGDEEAEEEIDEQPEANNQVFLGAAFFGERPAQFGTVALGESRTLGFSVTSLQYTRTIQSVSIGGDHPGDFSLDPGSCTTGTVVGEGASCTLSITFTPTADGLRQAALDIEIDPGVSGGRSLEGGDGSTPAPTTPTDVGPTDTAPAETNAETAAP